MAVKYRDWLKKQHFRTKPCDGDQDEESHYKEKIAAIFEKLVEFAEPVILDEHGELPVFSIFPGQFLKKLYWKCTFKTQCH